MQVSADQMLDELRVHGFRITRARRAICKVLADAAADHLTAADVAERTAGQGVDPSTVYRTLEALERLGLVEHIHLGHGPGGYHVAPERPHHHLVCEECGRTVDVPLAELRRAVERVTEPHGFVPDPAHFAIVGRCAACAGEDLGPAPRTTPAGR
jgi:Fur family ferric uptake transcriptional regulator